MLGIARGWSLYLARQHFDETERDRLAAQARVVDDNLGRQIHAVDPDRARNVARPRFGAHAKAPALSAAAAPAKTGTEGDWARF